MQVRYAVLNTVALLRQNKETHAVLAQAMSRGASVAECIKVIESSLDLSQLSPSGLQDNQTILAD